MITKKNLFGKAILNLLDAKPDKFFVCDEQGEYELDLSFYISNRLKKHEEEALKHVNGNIIDIGCGSGRIMKILQQRGYNVTGLDIDDKVIEICRKLSIKNAFKDTYENMQKNGVFDTVLLLNRNIGIPGSVDGIIDMLQDIYGNTSKGARLIFDSLEVRKDKETERGVQKQKLRYHCKSDYSDWFYWIRISSSRANELLKLTRWKIIEKHEEHDEYSIVAKKVEETRVRKKEI